MSADKRTRFMKAYRACHEPFIRYCSALAYCKMDAEDLVQDVLLSAFTKFEQIEKKSQLHHYLLRAARNRSISIWRKRRKETDMPELSYARLESQGIPADMLVDIDLLYRNLDKLPSAQRDAIVLFEISGYSMREIAEIQESTEGAVKTKVSRGRDKLRELLDESERSHSTASVMNVLRSIAL
jgi:RNA polymerase sigma-70 factor (ECF subfamily)